MIGRGARNGAAGWFLEAPSVIMTKIPSQCMYKGKVSNRPNKQKPGKQQGLFSPCFLRNLLYECGCDSTSLLENS